MKNQASVDYRSHISRLSTGPAQKRRKKEELFVFSKRGKGGIFHTKKEEKGGIFFLPVEFKDQFANMYTYSFTDKTKVPKKSIR